MYGGVCVRGGRERVRVGEGVQFVKCVCGWEGVRIGMRRCACANAPSSPPPNGATAAARDWPLRCSWPVQVECPDGTWLRPVLGAAHSGREWGQAGPVPLGRASGGSCVVLGTHTLLGGEAPCSGVSGLAPFPATMCSC